MLSLPYPLIASEGSWYMLSAAARASDGSAYVLSGIVPARSTSVETGLPGTLKEGAFLNVGLLWGSATFNVGVGVMSSKYLNLRQMEARGLEVHANLLKGGSAEADETQLLASSVDHTEVRRRTHGRPRLRTSPRLQRRTCRPCAIAAVVKSDWVGCLTEHPSERRGRLPGVAAAAAPVELGSTLEGSLDRAAE